MGYSDSFESPVSVGIDGKSYNVAPLSQRDYLPWLDELTTKMRERDRGLIPATMKADQRMQILRNIEMTEMIPDDLEAIIFTAKGTIRVLEMALGKAMMNGDPAHNSEVSAKVEQFINTQAAVDNRALMMRVSGLLTRRRIAQLLGIPMTDPSDAPPNPPQPAEPGV